MRPSYWIVIVAAGGEPMAVVAPDAADVRRMLGDVALCAPTTRAALLRAGWTDESMMREGDSALEIDEAA